MKYYAECKKELESIKMIDNELNQFVMPIPERLSTLSQLLVENCINQMKNEDTKLKNHNKDNVDYAESKVVQTIDELKKLGTDIARIVIPDVKDEVSETKVNIPMNAISALSKGNINIEISTENARISLPKESIQDLSQVQNGDLYFRLVPVKDEKAQDEIKARADKELVIKAVSGNSGIQVLGRPMAIDTNMSQRPVYITLPLKDVTIPTDPAERQAFLNDLGVYIEHSDGEKVLAKGEIVEYAPGVLGIKFTINKFSDFTIVKLNKETTSVGNWENSSQGWKYIKNGQPATGWNLVNNSWYLMDSTGIMQTDWKQSGDAWYYLKENGAMATGWISAGGNW